MRDERRLDVDEIDALPQLEAGRQRGAADHHPILRIEGEVTRRLAQHAGLASRAPGYDGATSQLSQPSAARSRRKIWIDVETPLTRGKYTSEIINTRTGRPDWKTTRRIFASDRYGDSDRSLNRIEETRGAVQYFGH